MFFSLWLFILSGASIVIFLTVKVLQEKYIFNFPLRAWRERFEKSWIRHLRELFIL